MPKLLAHVLRYMSLAAATSAAVLTAAASVTSCTPCSSMWVRERLKATIRWCRRSMNLASLLSTRPSGRCRVCAVPAKLRRTNSYIRSWIPQYIRTLCEHGNHVDRDTLFAKDRRHQGHGEILSFAEQCAVVSANRSFEPQYADKTCGGCHPKRTMPTQRGASALW